MPQNNGSKSSVQSGVKYGGFDKPLYNSLTNRMKQHGKDSLSQEERHEYRAQIELKKIFEANQKEQQQKQGALPMSSSEGTVTTAMSGNNSRNHMISSVNTNNSTITNTIKEGQHNSVQQAKPSTSSQQNGNANTPTAARKKKSLEECTEEQLEPEHRWWQEYEDGVPSVKKRDIMWDSLEHQGIMFPPAYSPCNIPLIYGDPSDKSKQTKIKLPIQLEELCYYWCTQAMGLESETKDIFITNFWGEFQERLKSTKKQALIGLITNFHWCDFSLIRGHVEAQRERKKGISKEIKEENRESGKKAEAGFRFCMIDGYRTKVGNIMVEPPGLFKGRGEHPKQGKLKDRITPSSVTINTDNSIPPPICHCPAWSWGSIVHDDTVSWLGYYKQETDDKESTKYIQLANTSRSKQEPDMKKYERARRLCDIVGEIRKDYQVKISMGDNLFKKQLGTAIYFIDRLALRVGNEKNTDEEADTVGCTSLRVEHVKLDYDTYKAGNPKVTLDFLGKDSIRYLNEVKVPIPVFKNLALFSVKKKSEGGNNDNINQKNKKNSSQNNNDNNRRSDKSPHEDLFDQITPSTVNEYLHSFMPDLTAKVFRTYNASYTLEQQLQLYKPPTGVDNNGEPLVDTTEQLMAFYNEANKKVAILCNHQKAESKSHEDQVAKLAGKGMELKDRLSLLQKHKQELENGNCGLENKNINLISKMPKNIESCNKMIMSITAQIKKQVSNMESKESNKNVSLSTSKINYMDPRITIAFCKRSGLDVGKVFSKTILMKFPWAMDVSANYRFQRQAKTPRSIAAQVKLNNGVVSNTQGIISGSSGSMAPLNIDGSNLKRSKSPMKAGEGGDQKIRRMG